MAHFLICIQDGDAPPSLLREWRSAAATELVVWWPTCLINREWVLEGHESIEAPFESTDAQSRLWKRSLHQWTSSWAR
jgi:hypothetical protein